MNCIYKKALVIGSSMITNKIAAFLKAHGINTMVLEKGDGISSFVRQHCAASGIPYYSGDSRELCEHILANALSSTVIVSASNLLIFPQEIVSRPNIKIINYHNSKLPKYRGVNAEAWQIFDMENEAGVTWHFIDEQIDTGNIIVQSTIPLNDSITSLKLLKLQNAEAYDLFLGFYEALLNGSLAGTPQAVGNDVVIHYSKDIPNNGVLNLEWDYRKISAFLRAMDYGPMRTLGNGRIVLDQTVYCWGGYEFKKQADTKSDVHIEDDRIIIQKGYDSVVLKKCLSAAIS